jgi:predicted 2-oxoglutarate/Fe(II)-dependent dioxygenase YbiX
MIEESRKTYDSLYGEDPERSFVDLGTVNVMGVGHGMAVHADNPPSLMHGIDTPHGLVLYLNDDYEGGEIYYPKLGIAIKPEAGSLVIHPGTVQYAHGVIPVTSGIRYATTAFSKKPIA